MGQSLPLPCPYLPGVQSIVPLHTEPSGILPRPYFNPTVKAYSFKVCFPTLSPSLPLAPPNSFNHLSPVWPPGPHFPTLTSQARLLLASPLGYFLPSAVGYPETPLSIISAFSLSLGTHLSRDSHTPSLPCPFRTVVPSPPESLRPLHPRHNRHSHWIQGFSLHPVPVLSFFHPSPPSSASSQLSSSQIPPSESPGNKARKIRVIWEVNRNWEGSGEREVGRTRWGGSLSSPTQFRECHCLLPHPPSPGS